MHYISGNLLTGALLAFCCTSATAWKFVTNEQQFLKPGFKQQFLDLAKVTGHGSVEGGIHVSGVTFGNIETDSWAHDWAYPNNASSLLGLDLPPPLLSSLKVRQDGSDIEYACGEASCTNDGFATIEEGNVYRSIVNIGCGAIEYAAIPAGITSIGVWIDGRICSRAELAQFECRVALGVALSNVQTPLVSLFDEQVCQQLLAEPRNQQCSGTGNSKTCQLRNDDGVTGQAGVSVEVLPPGEGECFPSDTHHCEELDVDV